MEEYALTSAYVYFINYLYICFGSIYLIYLLIWSSLNVIIGNLATHYGKTSNDGLYCIFENVCTMENFLLNCSFVSIPEMFFMTNILQCVCLFPHKQLSLHTERQSKIYFHLIFMFGQYTRYIHEHLPSWNSENSVNCFVVKYNIIREKNTIIDQEIHIKSWTKMSKNLIFNTKYNDRI